MRVKIGAISNDEKRKVVALIDYPFTREKIARAFSDLADLMRNHNHIGT